MSEGSVSNPLFEKLFKAESEEDKKNIIGYKFYSCNMGHTTEPWFNYHEETERRRKPIVGGKIIYVNKLCETKPSECENGDACKFCHTEMELLFHPVEYKAKMCEKGPHPLQEFCPNAHDEDEIRDVTGYQTLVDEILSASSERKFEFSPDSSPKQDEIPQDEIADLPTVVKPQGADKIK